MKKLFIAAICTLAAGLIFTLSGCEDGPVKNSQGPTNTPVAQQINYMGDSGTKRYHKLSCKRLPKDLKAVPFDSPMSAYRSGYKPCKRCKPETP